METAGGQKLTLTDGPGSVEVADSNGNSVTLETRGITVNAAAKVTLNSSALEINSGAVTVNAGMSRGHFIFTGIGALMFLAAFVFILRTKWGRAAFDRFKLRMPGARAGVSRDGRFTIRTDAGDAAAKWRTDSSGADDSTGDGRKRDRREPDFYNS